MLGWEGNM